jgi:hypothetical protein
MLMLLLTPGKAQRSVETGPKDSMTGNPSNEVKCLSDHVTKVVFLDRRRCGSVLDQDIILHVQKVFHPLEGSKPKGLQLKIRTGSRMNDVQRCGCSIVHRPQAGIPQWHTGSNHIGICLGESNLSSMGINGQSSSYGVIIMVVVVGSVQTGNSARSQGQLETSCLVLVGNGGQKGQEPVGNSLRRPVLIDKATD